MWTLVFVEKLEMSFPDEKKWGRRRPGTTRLRLERRRFNCPTVQIQLSEYIGQHKLYTQLPKCHRHLELVALVQGHGVA